MLLTISSKYKDLATADIFHKYFAENSSCRCRDSNPRPSSPVIFCFCHAINMSWPPSCTHDRRLSNCQYPGDIPSVTDKLLRWSTNFCQGPERVSVHGCVCNPVLPCYRATGLDHFIKYQTGVWKGAGNTSFNFLLVFEILVAGESSREQLIKV